MKHKIAFCLSVLAVVTIGCAAPKPPEFVRAPTPPGEWKVIEERKQECPSINGAYELIPRVAVFQKDSSWDISNGKAYDFVLLLPLDRAFASKRVPDGSFAFSRSSLLFESGLNWDTLQVTSPVFNSMSYESHILKRAEHDFHCEAGNLIFPEFVIQGGSEGATLSGRVHRQATKTLSGDLMFYEQVRGYKTIHKYYLFKSKDS